MLARDGNRESRRSGALEKGTAESPSGTSPMGLGSKRAYEKDESGRFRSTKGRTFAASMNCMRLKRR
jgi:hypothetical protein